MTKNCVADSSNADQVNAAKKMGEDRDRDVEYVALTPRGRRWIYDITHDTCHVRLPSSVPGDAHSMAFNEGARSVGEALLERLRTVSPSLYTKMITENHFND